MYVLALSATAITGLFLLATALVGGAATVTVGLIGRESKKQNEQAAVTVTEFERAWNDRGKLVEGYKDDIETLQERCDRVEKRADRAEQGEQRCLEGYEHAMQRIAVLEERLGIRRD